MIVWANDLLGARVRDCEGVVIGRIEEMKCTVAGNRCEVDSYLIGASALVERLGAWALIRPIRRVLPAWMYRRYQVLAPQLDLRNPRRPRTTIALRELRRR